MAARKKATRATRNGHNGEREGWVKVETHLVGFWKPEIPGQAVEGIVGEAIDVQGADRKTNTFYSLTLINDDSGPVVGKDGKKVSVGAGQMIGVGGKMLLIFLRGREGKEVLLEFEGLGPAKAGQSAPKLFRTYERPSEE